MKLLRNSFIVGIAILLLTVGGIIGILRSSTLLLLSSTVVTLLLLSLWFYLNTRSHGDRFTLLIQAGLFFGMVGLVALTFVAHDGFAFLIGSGAFMLGQLCLTLGFGNNVFQGPGPAGLALSIPLSIALLAFGAFFSTDVLARVDADLYIPMLITMTTMIIMGVAASARFSRTYLRSFLIVLVGTLLFIAATSILLADRFIRPIDHAAILTLICCKLGLFLIALGCIVHARTPTHVRRQEVLST